MTDESSERRGEQILAQLETIATEGGNNIRRRLAADLAQFPLDEDAFAEAVTAFDETLRRHRPRDEREYSDAQIDAIESFLLAYLRTAGGVS